MIVIKRARERGGYEKGLDESSNQNLEVEGHCARKNELTKQALCKVVTNDIFALECLHSILSNCDSVLMSTVIIYQYYIALFSIYLALFGII